MATSRDYSRSVITASDEVKDILCEPCEQDGKKTKAEGFCVDCSEYLCGQCYKTHKLFKAFRYHVLQDKDDMPQNVTEAGVNDLCSQKCTKHPNEIIKFFCGSCDSVGCSTCIILDHRQCNKVVDIPKLATSKDTQEEIQTFIKKAETMSNQIKDSRRKIKSSSNIEDDLQQVAVAELEKLHDLINKFFYDLKNEMQQKVETIHKSNETILAAASKKYDSIDKELTHIKTDVDKTKKDGKSCEAFINMKHSELVMKRIETELKTLEKESKIEKYEIFPSLLVQGMLEKISEICMLETETILLMTSEKQQVPMPKISPKTDSKMNTTTKASKGTTHKSLKLLTGITIKTSSDTKSPNIKGLTVIYERYVAVTDQANKSVKVIDTNTGKVQSEISMGEKVWALSNMEDEEIAVTLQSKIQLLSVSKTGTMCKTSELVTNTTYFHLLYNKGNFIAAQCSKVHILDMQGKILRTFDTRSNGEKLFSNCLGLAISSDKESIYVSDLEKHTLTNMTLDGSIKAIYKDKDLKYPWGVAVDNEGHVYVCATSCIHELSADCIKLQVITGGKAGHMNFSKENKLIVGNYSNVYIYDLK